MSSASVFYSQNASGNFSTLANWDTNPAGGGANPVIGDYTSGAHVFVIQDGHTVTLDISIDADSIVVGEGVSGILSIGNDANPDTIVARNGFLINSGGSVLHTSTIVTDFIELRGDLINNGSFDLKTGTGRDVKTAFTNTVPTNIHGNNTPQFSNIVFVGSAVVTAQKSLDIEGSVTLETGSTFNDGDSSHTVGGNWTENGTGQRTGSGNIILDGASSVITAAAIFHNLTFSGNTAASINGTPTINGDLLITNNASVSTTVDVDIYGDFTVSIGSDYTASGGATDLISTTDTQRLDVQGTATFNYLYAQNGGVTLPKIYTGIFSISTEHRIYNDAHVMGDATISLRSWRVMSSGGSSRLSGNITIINSGGNFRDDQDGNFFLTSGDITVEGFAFLNTLDTMRIGGNLSINIGYLVLNEGRLIQDSLGKTFSSANGTSLYIRGVDNFPDGFSAYNFGESSSVLYDRPFNQTVRGNITYGRLLIYNNSTKTVDGPLDINESILINNGSTLDLGGFSHTIANDINYVGGAVCTINSTGTIIMDGTGTTSQFLDFNIVYNLENLFFTNTAPTGDRYNYIDADLSIGGTFSVTNTGGNSSNFMYLDPDDYVISNDGDGSFNIGANVEWRTSGATSFDSVNTFNTVTIDSLSELYFDGTTQNIPGDISYGTVELRGNGNKTLTGDINIRGNLRRVGETPILYDAGYQIRILGDWDLNTNYTEPTSITGTALFDGIDQSIAGSDFNHLYLSNSGTKTLLGNPNIDDSLRIDSNVVFDVNTRTINIEGSVFLHDSAQYIQTSGTTIFDGASFFPAQNITFNDQSYFANMRVEKAAFTSLNLFSDIRVNYTLAIYNSAGILVGNDRTIYIGNEFYVGQNTSAGSASYLSNGNSRIVLDGNLDQIIYNFAGSSFNDIVMSGIGEKRLETTASTFDINGDLTIETGATGDGSWHPISIAGNWINNGSFQPGGQTVTFDGTSKQTITSSSFNNLIINNVVDTVKLVGNITCSGNLTINDNTILDANDTGNYSITVENYWYNNGGGNNGQFLARQGGVTFNGGNTRLYTGGNSLGKRFYNLTSSALSSTSTQMYGDVWVDNDFTVVDGSGPFYTRNFTLYVGADFINEGNGFDQNTGSDTIILFGSGTHEFNPGTSIDYRKIQMIGTGTYELSNDLIFDNAGGNWALFCDNGTFDLNGHKLQHRRANESADIFVRGGTLEIDSGATLELANQNDVVITAGTFRLLGESASGLATMTSTTGGYDFDATGGTIEARYYRIQNTRTDGLYLGGTTTIHGTNNFSDGAFSGGANNYYISFDDINLPTDTVRNVTFSSGPSGNVDRSTGANTDSIIFLRPKGSLAGESFENDPDNEIIWVFPTGKTWDRGAGTDSWFDAANWLPDGVPDSTDDVTLDRTTVAGAYDVDIDQATIAKCRSLTIAEGGSGNDIILDFTQIGGKIQVFEDIVLSDGNSVIQMNDVADTLIIAGGWDNSGDLISGGGVVMFNDSTGGSHTIVSGGTGNTQDFDGFVINAPNSTYSISGDQVEINGDFNLIAGTLNSSERVFCAGDWNAAGGTLFNSTEWVYMDGNTQQHITGGIFYNLRIDNSADSIKLLSNLTVNSDIQLQNGVLDADEYFLFIKDDWTNNIDSNALVHSGLGTVVFDGVIDQQIGGSATTKFNHVTMQGTGNKSVVVDTRIVGNWIINSGPGVVDINTYTVDGTSASTTAFEMNGSSLRIEGASNYPIGFDDYNMNGGEWNYRCDCDVTMAAIDYYELEVDNGTPNANQVRRTASGDITVKDDILIRETTTKLDMNGFDLIINPGITGDNSVDFNMVTGGQQVDWGGGTFYQLGDGFRHDPDLDSFNNIVFGGTQNKRLYDDIVLTGNLMIQDGVYFHMDYTVDCITPGKTFTLTSGSRLYSAVASPDTAFPTGYSIYDVDPSSGTYLDGSNNTQILHYAPNYGDLFLTSNGTVNMGGDLDVEGELDNSTGGNSVTLVDNGFNINVAGVVDLMDYTPSATSTLTLDGGDQTIRDHGASTLLLNNIRFTGAGTKDFNSGDDDVTVSGNVYIDSGITVTTNEDWFFSGDSFINYKGSFYHTGNDFEFDGTGVQIIDPGADNDFFEVHFSNGGSDAKTFINNGIDVNSNNDEDFLVNSGATVDFGNGLTHYIGSEDFIIEGVLISSNSNITFDYAGTQLIDSFTANIVTHTGGGESRITNGTWKCDSLIIDVGDEVDIANSGDRPITIYGSFINNGEFFDGAGTLYFESKDTSTQYIKTNGYNLNKVKFNQAFNSTRRYVLVDGGTIVDSLLVGNGATIDMNAQTLIIGNNDGGNPAGEVVHFQMGSTLEIDANASLQFNHNDQNPLLLVEGTFRAVGTDGNLASITRSTGGSETDVILTGNVEAQYYDFQYIADSGVRVRSTATLHPTRNFSDGNWANMQTTGGGRKVYLQLDADMTGVDSLRNITFNYGGSPSVGVTYNIARDPSATDTVFMGTGMSGLLSAFGYEDDDGTAAGGKIIWDAVSEVTWDGSESINWHDSANWTPEIVPTQFITANIPLTANNPTVFADTAECNNLNITTGILTLEDDLWIVGDVNLGTGSSGLLFVSDDSVDITIEGSWTVSSGAIFSNGSGKVIFNKANGSASITPGNQKFANLELSGGGNYTMIGGTITVEDSLIIGNTASLTLSTNNYDLNIKGDLINNGTMDDNVSGTVYFNGNRDQTIKAGRFYNLVLDSSGIKTAYDSMSIRRDVTINADLTAAAGCSIDFSTDAGDNHDLFLDSSATFNDGGGTHYFYGDNWYGFGTYLGTGTMIFTDARAKFLHSNGNNSFNNLVIEPSQWTYLQDSIFMTGDLTIKSASSGVECYGYIIRQTSGGGQFTMENNTRIDIGGPNNFPDGFASYSMDPGSRTLYEGAMDQIVRSATYGRIDFYNANTKTLEGDIDVEGDLYIFNAGTLDVTSSNYNINIAGRWYNFADGNFLCNEGTVIFDGNADQRIDDNLTGIKDFYNVVINNSGGLVNAVQAGTKVIRNNLTVLNGTYRSNTSTTTQVGNNILAQGGGFDNARGTFELNYSGNDTVYIQTNGTGFFNLDISITDTANVVVLDDLDVANTFNLNSGVFNGNGNVVTLGNTSDIIQINGTYKMGAGGELRIGNNASVNISTSGRFEAIGSASQIARISRRNTGTYNFNINGEVAAYNYIFEYMHQNGVIVTSTATIDTTYNFSNGTFTNGTNNGTLLRIENNQALSGSNRIENISLPSNPGGGAFNFTKVATSVGTIEIYNATGTFAGETYDNDPNNIIDWINPVTLTWKPLAASTDWYDKNNWTVSSGPDTIPYAETDVVIPSSVNPPSIIAAGAISKNLEIETGGFLTLNTPADADSDLVILGDLTIGGNFSLTSATDTVYVQSNWTKTTGAFSAGTGGVVFMIPSSGVSSIDNGTAEFYDLIIGGLTEVQLDANTSVRNDFTVLTGATMNFDNREFTFRNGDFINNGTLTAENGSTLSFNSTSPVTTIFNPGPGTNFNNIGLIGDTGTTVVLTGNNLSANANVSITDGTLDLNSLDFNFGDAVATDILTVGGGDKGCLNVNANASLNMANTASVTVTAGGILKILGLNGSNLATLTNQGSAGRYAAAVNSGGELQARYFLMEYMDATGVNVKTGAVLDSANNFSDGTFANGASGGRYLLLENSFNATDTIRNTVFNSGPLYNVRRTVGGNPAIFLNSSGVLFAWTGEDDVPANGANTGNIIWVSDFPIATWQGTTNSDWHTHTNWDCGCVPDENYGVYINNRANDPIIDTADALAQDVTIFVGGILTIQNSNDLTVNGSLTNSGTLDVVNGSASTIEVHDLWAMGGSSTFNNGNASTVVLKTPIGSNIFTTGGDCFYNLHFDSTSTFQTNSAVCVEGDLRILQGTLEVVDASHSINIGGDYENQGTLVNNATTVTFDGADQSIGRGTFNNLNLSGSGTKTIAGDVTVNADMTIPSGITLNGGTGNDTLDIKGDFTIAFGATYSSNTGRMKFSGSANQDINGPSTGITFNKLTIGNTAGDIFQPQIVSNTPITISSGGEINLQDGVFDLQDGTDTFTVEDNVTVIGGSASSYISSIMKKVGDDEFLFPIGSNNRVGMVRISAPTNASSAFAAQYTDNAYVSQWVPVDSQLTRVSGLEYWDVYRAAGADSVYVYLYWSDGTWSDINDLDSLVVAHYDGAYKWDNKGQGATGGDLTSGWIRTNNKQGDFSPFTLGSIGGPGVNPLPIELLSFDATLDRGDVYLTWTTAMEQDNAYFMVERSKNSTDFESLDQVDGAGNSVTEIEYVFVDANPYEEVSYYRLKQVDFDGTQSYSKIVAVNNTKIQETFYTQLFPNPSRIEDAFLYLQGTDEEMVILEIIDVTGKIMHEEVIDMREGKTKVIHLADRVILNSGLYFVNVLIPGKEIMTKQWIIK